MPKSFIYIANPQRPPQHILEAIAKAIKCHPDQAWPLKQKTPAPDAPMASVGDTQSLLWGRGACQVFSSFVPHDTSVKKYSHEVKF